jgi:glycosyltransferase involved in cell wall biosynthesis
VKISVITVSYNSERTILETIQSVASQKNANFDYTVADGNSTDKTNQIVAGAKQTIGEFQHIIDTDNGIYDAMNKAVSKVSGEVIGFLNSDDFFADSEVLKSLQDLFVSSKADVVYGDIDIFADDSTRKVVRAWRSGEYSKKSLKFGWHPPHPAFYIRKDLFESLGGFDLKVGLAADYDLMIRALMSPGCRVAYLEKVLVKMRQGGASTSGLKPILKGWLTSQIPWQKLGMPVQGFLAATLKPLSKLKQIRI